MKKKTYFVWNLKGSQRCGICNFHWDPFSLTKPTIDGIQASLLEDQEHLPHCNGQYNCSVSVLLSSMTLTIFSLNEYIWSKLLPIDHLQTSTSGSGSLAIYSFNLPLCVLGLYHPVHSAGCFCSGY